MTPGAWEQAAAGALDALDASHLLRHRRLITPVSATRVLYDGRECVNFASNDYLGLIHHPRTKRAVEQAIGQGGTGSGASALVSGFNPAHASAERHIAQWKGSESAVLLPSGYQANHAAIQTLAAVAEHSGRGIRFLLDKLCHASLIDAVRGAGGAFRVFPHNGLGKLRRLLAEASPGEFQVVVSESIFSMDGDAADLPGLAALKREHPFLLLLDEAHATGVYGPAGSGLAAELGLRAAVDVSVMTLSKSIGCAGGAVCGSRRFCDALVNLARAYVFSTSLPPAAAVAAETAILVMQAEPQLQHRLRERARDFREELLGAGWPVPPGDSPIIPVVLGDESAALDAAERLLSRGIFTVAIRPPTVARGASRLRITLSSAHSDQDIALLLRELAALALERTTRKLPFPGTESIG